MKHLLLWIVLLVVVALLAHLWLWGVRPKDVRSILASLWTRFLNWFDRIPDERDPWDNYP